MRGTGACATGEPSAELGSSRGLAGHKAGAPDHPATLPLRAPRFMVEFMVERGWLLGCRRGGLKSRVQTPVLSSSLLYFLRLGRPQVNPK